MAYVLALALGAVAGIFLLVVAGEIFYLFYWRKRPLAYPRGNSVPVAPINETEVEAVAGERGIEGGGNERDVVISVTAEYQIAALHQDLVEKLFPAVDVPPNSTQTTQDLMGPTRLLFTIAEETKEELEGLDIPDASGKVESRLTISDVLKGELAISLSDVQLSPLGPLSPLSSSTPFDSPVSSPEHSDFITPNGTPSRSPLISLSRLPLPPIASKTSSLAVVTDEISCHAEDCDCCCGPPPPAPPSPTRPSFPFLVRAPSPGKSSDFPSERSTGSSSSMMHETLASDCGGFSTSPSSNFNHPCSASAQALPSPPQKAYECLSSPGAGGVPASSETTSRRSLMANGFHGGGESEEARTEVLRAVGESKNEGDNNHDLHARRQATEMPLGSPDPSSPLPRACTSVYENGTFSPFSSPSSPELVPLSSAAPTTVPYLGLPDDDSIASIGDSPPSSSPSSACTSPHSRSPSSSSCSSPPCSPASSPAPPDFLSPPIPIATSKAPTPGHHALEHRVQVRTLVSDSLPPYIRSAPSRCPAPGELRPAHEMEKRTPKHSYSPSQTAAKGETRRPRFQMGR